MVVKFKSYKAEDKYEDSWRRYGDSSGGEVLDKNAGLNAINMSTADNGYKTLTISINPGAKSDGYVVRNAQAFLKAANIEAEYEAIGSNGKFTVRNVEPDAIIKAAEALSGAPTGGKDIGGLYPLLDESAAAEIIKAEKALLRDSMVEDATGKAPATGGRTNT